MPRKNSSVRGVPWRRAKWGTVAKSTPLVKRTWMKAIFVDPKLADEASLQEMAEDTLTAFAVWWLHLTNKSTRSMRPGIPDLIFGDPTRIFFWELKHERGRPRREQIEELKTLIETNRGEKDPDTFIRQLRVAIIRGRRELAAALSFVILGELVTPAMHDELASIIEYTREKLL